MIINNNKINLNLNKNSNIINNPFIINVNNQLLLLQRIDLQTFHSLFHKIMYKLIIMLKKSINSYGFHSFDGFLMTCYEKIIKYELKTSNLQLKLKKILNHASVVDLVAKKSYVDAKEYADSCLHLSKMISSMTEKHISKFWKIDTLGSFFISLYFI